MDPKEQWQKIKSQFNDRWRALSGGQKTIASLATIGVLVALFYLGNLIFTPRYAVLFSNLQASEAGKIVDQLKQLKVPYQLADGGGTIEVPQSQVYSVRIELASDGTLQNSDSGWSLFDQNSLGMTDFQQQVDYQRALQDELRNTIIQLNGVQDAMVNLVIPQKSVFMDDSGTPSASVLLKMEPGVTLSAGQVSGIQDLVVGSVEGLKPENVHIVDTNGDILNAGLTDQNQGAIMADESMTQQKVTQAYDSQLQQKVQSMLDQVLGPGQAVALVNATLDFSQKETSTVNYGNGSILSQQQSNSSGTGTAPGGVTGTSGSMPTVPQYTTGSTSSSSYNQSQSTTNYDVSTTKTSEVQAPGVVKRISTAVVINSASGVPVSTGELQKLVAAAIGFDQQRGDQVTVTSMPFNTSYQNNLSQKMAQQEAAANQMKLIELGAGVLLAIILLVLLFLLLRRRQVVEPEEMLAHVQEIMEVPPQPEMTEEERRAFLSSEEKLELIRELAQEKPEEVAEIIRVWITE